MEQKIQLNEQECLPTCTADFNPTLNDIKQKMEKSS